MKPMEVRRNELLTDTAAAVERVCKEFNLPDDLAEQVGAAVADTLADDWGGQILTIPKDYAYKLAQRDREILDARRRGAGLAKLARDYDMSERNLRRLLQRAELREPDLRQHKLFNQETSR